MIPLRHVLGLVVLLSIACSSYGERWAQLHFQGLSFQNLHAQTLLVLEVEGYNVRMRDPNRSGIESEWVYGQARGAVRGAARRKAIVEIEPVGDAFSVRIRVREEVIRTGGMLSSRIRDSDDWEEQPDNFDDAEFLAAKLRAHLIDQSVEVTVGEEAGLTP